MLARANVRMKRFKTLDFFKEAMPKCPECRTEVKVGEGFCSSCGYRLKGSILKYAFIIIGILIIIVALFLFISIGKTEGVKEPQISSTTRAYFDCMQATFDCFIENIDDIYDWENYCQEKMGCEEKFKPYIDLIHQDMIDDKEYFCEFNTKITLKLYKKLQSNPTLNGAMPILTEDELYLQCVAMLKEYEKQLKQQNEEANFVEEPVDYAVGCVSDADCPERRPYCDIGTDFCVKEKPDYPENFCMRKEHCKEGEYCVANRCKVNTCETNWDCAANHECVNGLCMRICIEDEDCERLERCIDRFCIASV